MAQTPVPGGLQSSQSILSMARRKVLGKPSSSIQGSGKPLERADRSASSTGMASETRNGHGSSSNGSNGQRTLSSSTTVPALMVSRTSSTMTLPSSGASQIGGLKSPRRVVEGQEASTRSRRISTEGSSSGQKPQPTSPNSISTLGAGSPGIASAPALGRSKLSAERMSWRDFLREDPDDVLPAYSSPNDNGLTSPSSSKSPRSPVKSPNEPQQPPLDIPPAGRRRHSSVRAARIGEASSSISFTRTPRRPASLSVSDRNRPLPSGLSNSVSITSFGAVAEVEEEEDVEITASRGRAFSSSMVSTAGTPTSVLMDPSSASNTNNITTRRRAESSPAAASGKSPKELLGQTLKMWQRRSLRKRMDANATVFIRDRKHRRVLEAQVDRMRSQLPHAVRSSILEETYPIVLASCDTYVRQLGINNVLTQGAIAHLRKLAERLGHPCEY